MGSTQTKESNESLGISTSRSKYEISNEDIFNDKSDSSSDIEEEKSENLNKEKINYLHDFMRRRNEEYLLLGDKPLDSKTEIEKIKTKICFLNDETRYFRLDYYFCFYEKKLEETVLHEDYYTSLISWLKEEKSILNDLLGNGQTKKLHEKVKNQIQYEEDEKHRNGIRDWLDFVREMKK
jgi:hypothetical protein